ncbi:MAG: phosphatase PAP2 family protein [Fimbriimonadaceae bacterium]|nr:phosphatase PAP2 family protein [Chitinophagales bacterium]
MFWAFSVSFAQVYVGVHYPLDILGGAIIGICISCILFLAAKRIVMKKNFPYL